MFIIHRNNYLANKPRMQKIIIKQKVKYYVNGRKIIKIHADKMKSYSNLKRLQIKYEKGDYASWTIKKIRKNRVTMKIFNCFVKCKNKSNRFR